MQINSNRLRGLRAGRQWSQEQLASLSGLNLRTIQRLEAGARVSTESLRALAAVFEVPAETLLAACTRRLRDAGLSPWRQLTSLAPVAGILVLLYLLTFPHKVPLVAYAVPGVSPAE